MSSWDPTQYLRFAGSRLRPALDLLARIEVADPRFIVDAGCGPGNVTQFLAGRWPAAEYLGIDNSAEMLAIAATEHPSLTWLNTDLDSWQPDQPVDVFYSNAALHWLDNHESLFPRIVRMLAPGGVLGVQMPHNYAEPTHTTITDVVESGPWADHLRTIQRRVPVAEPGFYFDVLQPHVAELEIWETEYFQVLEGDNAVAEWTKGSVLRPLLSALERDDHDLFFDQYSAIVQGAYPMRSDGTTLLPFKRLFIVARA